MARYFWVMMRSSFCSVWALLSHLGVMVLSAEASRPLPLLSVKVAGTLLLSR